MLDPLAAEGEVASGNASSSCQPDGASSSRQPVSSEDLSARPGFAGEIRQSLLDGWEPQPSPCCAAASVAGAFNSIWARDRSNSQRISVLEVTSLMASFCEKKALGYQRNLERRIGADEGTLTPLLQAAEAVLEQRGFQWSVGRANPCEVSNNMFQLALQEVLERTPRFSCVNKTLGVALTGSLGHVKVGSRPRSRTNSGEIEAPAASSARNTTTDSPRLGPDFAAERVGSAKGKGRAPSHPAGSKQSKSILRELGRLISKRRATRRLQGERPRTTDIGSWGIIQAARDLAAKHESAQNFKVSVFLGKKTRGSRAAVEPISQHDDVWTVGQQWEAFKATFKNPQCALLFHLRNHYALLFGWREWWNQASGRLQRQILTARKRQKPSAWLDFEEVRETILGSSGYQVMILEKRLRVQFPGDAPDWSADGADMEDANSSSDDSDIQM